MNQERREQSAQPFTPTVSQRETAHVVIGTLSEIANQRAVIVIAGLSGVGKTAMLENMVSDIAQGGARVAELHDLLYATGQKAQELQGHTGPFITTATPFENRHIGDGLSKKGFSRVTTYQLQGMNSQEITDYVAGIMDRNRSSLTAEQIAQYSLGIPFLAQQLTHSTVTEDIAALMSADYLRSAIMYPYARLILNEARPFLNIPIPDETASALDEIAGNGRERHIYSSVYSALSRREQLREQGVQEESPFFVAPESEAIYDKMMALAGNEGARAIIEIVAPNLEPEDIERIQQALGYSYGRYDETRSTRMEMFRKADYRKAGIWTKDSEGSTAYLEGESADVSEIAAGYIRALEAGNLPIALNTEPMLVIHKHAHSDQSDQVAQLGWMVESFLQQRGIAYFVNNHVYGASYVYNPESRHIEQKSPIIQTR